jgi:hypothetical protein
MTDAMEHALHDNVVSILTNDATLAARVSDNWSDHVLRGRTDGLAGRRHLGASPLLEVGAVEADVSDDATRDHEEQRARIVVRARIVDYAADPGAIHDLVRDIALALEAQPQLNQPQTVVKFDLAIGTPRYRSPLWMCDVTLDVLMAFDPATRAVP